MSSLIPPIGSHLPTVQIVVRAAAPIAVDYIVTRFLQAPRAAMIPALGTLARVNRNVTTLEQVADSLLYFAYKALHSFFSRAENETTNTGVLQFEEAPSATLSNFEQLQKQFKKLLPEITWTEGSSFDQIDPSEIRKRWSNERTIARATALFAMAARDSGNLYDQLISATMDTSGREQRNKKMAELLSDKAQPYYERFCDPTKPSILFLYHLARGYGYYTRVGGAYYPHSLPLENSEIQSFYQDDTAQSNWRSIYNEQVALWVNVLKHLPADSIIRKWAVTDTPEAPLPSVYFPDNFLIG